MTNGGYNDRDTQKPTQLIFFSTSIDPSNEKKISLRLSLPRSFPLSPCQISFCLSFFLFSGTVFSCNKYTRPQRSLTHIKPCLPLKLFFLLHPSFFHLPSFLQQRFEFLSFEFQTGRISEGSFHNALSPFRQTADQRSCNEILKGPFTFCLSLSLLFLHHYLSQKSANKRAPHNGERKNIKADSFVILSPFVCLFSSCFLCCSPSQKCDYLPFPNTLHSHIRVCGSGKHGEKKRKRE